MQKNLPSVRIIDVSAAVLVLSLCSAGCGRQDGLPLAEVTGTVTLDGKPVSGALLEFIPQEPGGSTALGKTDEDGLYQMYFGSSRTGAVIGRTLVRITSDDRVVVGDESFMMTEVFPPKYNVRSEEIIEVVDGKNEIDFPCESEDFSPRRRRDDG